MRLLHDFVLVLRDPLEDEVRPSGLVAPANYRRPRNTGVVVAMNHRDGTVDSVDELLMVGDRVTFQPGAGVEVDLSVLTHLDLLQYSPNAVAVLLRESDILFRMEEK